MDINKSTPPAVTTLSAQSNVLAFALSATVIAAAQTDKGARIQLMPAGAFASWDGRPSCFGSFGYWMCDELAYQLILSAASNRKREFCLDYDHASVFGGAAPAAGWWTDFEFIAAGEGAGLWATGLKFTPAAARAIADGEYKYISPVFKTTDDGRVTEIINAALTNNPALDGMAAVALAAQNLSNTSNPNNPPNQPLETPPMKSLLVALGLSDTAAEHTALAAVTALQGQVGTLQTQLATAQAAAFDTSKHVLMADYAKLTSDYTALSAQVAQGEKSALVETLVKDGKLTAGQKDWALSTDLAGLKAFAASAVANPALAGGTQSGNAGAGNAGAGNAGAGAHGLSADERAMCAHAGFDLVAFAKTKAEMGLAV